MKVGIVASRIRRGQSGTGQYVLALLRALLSHAPPLELHVFAFESDLPLFDFARGEARLVPISEGRRGPWPEVLWHQSVLPRLARERGLDVLHVPSQRRMVWAHPCGLVATVQDVGAFGPHRDGDPRPSWSQRAFLHPLIARQDAVVTTSHSVASELVRLTGLPANRVSAVPCGVDRGRFSPAGREAAAARLAARHGIAPPFFLSVARLDQPANNHLRLLEAFTGFKTLTPSPWRLVLVGADGNGAGLVRAAVRRSPYAPDVDLVGFVPDDELADWYRVAGALVHVPMRDGFGLPPLEAMACGCPVLAARRPSLLDLCGDAAIYASALNTIDLRLQLGRLGFDAALRQQLGQRGAERAQHHDWRNTGAAMVEIYRRAAGRTATVTTEPAILTPTTH